MGFTYESRSSPGTADYYLSENHQRLGRNPPATPLLSDPAKSASVNIDNMPIVVYIGIPFMAMSPVEIMPAADRLHLAAAQGLQN